MHLRISKKRSEISTKNILAGKKLQLRPVQEYCYHTNNFDNDDPSHKRFFLPQCFAAWVVTKSCGRSGFSGCRRSALDTTLRHSSSSSGRNLRRFISRFPAEAHRPAVSAAVPPSAPDPEAAPLHAPRHRQFQRRYRPVAHP